MPLYIVTKIFVPFYYPDTEHDFFCCTKLTILYIYIYTTYSFIFLFYTGIRTQFHHAFITTKSTMRLLNDPARGGEDHHENHHPVLGHSSHTYLLCLEYKKHCMNFVSWEVFFTLYPRTLSRSRIAYANRIFKIFLFVF